MNLQGKELVSATTQRSARTLVATALGVLLAKLYDVPLTNLELLSVAIPVEAVRGAVWIVLTFQLLNHIVHWIGDLHTIQSWNSAEKVNGPALWDTGSSIISKLDGALDKLKSLSPERLASAVEKSDQMDSFIGELERCRVATEAIKNSVNSFRNYGGFYFYV